jgi:hypothetical protein
MDLKIWNVDMNYSHLTSDRDQRWEIVNTLMNLRVPVTAGNFLSCPETISFLQRPLLHKDNYFRT